MSVRIINVTEDDKTNTAVQTHTYVVLYSSSSDKCKAWISNPTKITKKPLVSTS